LPPEDFTGIFFFLICKECGPEIAGRKCTLIVKKTGENLKYYAMGSMEQLDYLFKNKA